MPVPMADDSVGKVMPPLHGELLARLTTYIVENEKTARKWLKAMGMTVPQSELRLHPYGKHQGKESLAGYFEALEAGEDVGLMSEAGCPAVADPGSEIVAEAHRRGIRVCPLVGPSSLLLALMGSGFNGQSFAFQGYLPIDKAERSRRVKELEGLASRLDQSQLFIETPFRNRQLLEELLRTCSPKTRLCIAVNLTGSDEWIFSTTIDDWRTRNPDLHKKPCIFILYKP